MLLLLLLLTTTNKNTIKKINCYHFCLRAALRALTAKFSAGSYIHKVQSPHLQNKKRWGVHRQKVHRHKIQNHGAEQGSSKSTSQNKLTHTDTHRHTQTHTDTHMYICTYTYTHACTHTHTNTYTHTHPHICFTGTLRLAHASCGSTAMAGGRDAVFVAEPLVLRKDHRVLKKVEGLHSVSWV